MTSEHLLNLQQIGQIERVTFSAVLLEKMLNVAESRLHDALRIVGHHQTTLQCLVHTLGVEPATVRVLDSLRKQRNLSDYEGELVTNSLLDECLAQAEALLIMAMQKLK